MVILQAPHELVQATMFLPNPLFGDNESDKIEANVRRAMNGDYYSYIKTNTNRQINLEFELERVKALELDEFVTAYTAYNIRLTDHRGRVWSVVLLNNPTELINANLKNRYQVTLQFEGSIL